MASKRFEDDDSVVLSPDHHHPLGSEALRSFKIEQTTQGQNGHSKWRATQQLQQGLNLKTILDPQGSLLQKWNKIILIACVLSVAIDPLFLYVPIIDDERKSLDLDSRLMISACVLRTLTDLFYILHIILQFRIGFIPPALRVIARRELIEDPLAIAVKYLCSYFLVDVLSVLPLPQLVLPVVIRSNIPIHKATTVMHFLEIVILTQYVPRLIRMFPVYKKVKRTSGIITQTAWAGAAFNLLLYIIASHVIGAFWYVFAIEQENKCWHNQNTLLSCFVKNPDDIDDQLYFNYGIFYPALSSLVKSGGILQKLVYCFWWGLRNLSSIGQNLQPSPYIGENLFCVFICIVGLLLFALLIGNIQKYLESTTVRVEEMRVRKQDAEQWMSHRMLPESLRDRIRRYEQYKWQETRGVDEDILIRNLPKDIKRDINRHLCLSLLMRVPWFSAMDEHLIYAMCILLKPVLYTANSTILHEGSTVDEMLFIMKGKLKSMTTNGGRTDFFNLTYLAEGDFCGEEMLSWALNPLSSACSNLPISTRTLVTITDLEAFALLRDDWKLVVSQFGNRLHNKQIQHTFRFYSQQWRTWAACFIQAAWRQHCRRKQQKRESEEKPKDDVAKEGGSSTLSFAVNMLTKEDPRSFDHLPSFAKPDFISEIK